MFSTREPLATYDQAIWRLAQKVVVGRPQAEIDGATETVADVFWFSDEKVKHDLSKALLHISGASVVARRGSRRMGVR